MFFISTLQNKKSHFEPLFAYRKLYQKLVESDDPFDSLTFGGFSDVFFHRGFIRIHYLNGNFNRQKSVNKEQKQKEKVELCLP